MPPSPSTPALLTETLYRDHHLWLRGWLRGRLKSSQDAEDLAQDTFLRVLRAPQKVEDLHEPRNFLVTIARGLTIDLFRRRSLEQQYLEALAALPANEWPSEEQRAITIEALVLLDAMLAGLGSKVREVFILAQFEEQTYPQIAAKVGLSLRTVNNYMAKAITHCCLYRLEHGLP